MHNLGNLATSHSLIPTGAGMDAWSPYALLPQLISLLIVTIIVTGLVFGYHRRLKKTKPNEAPVGLVLFCEMFIKWVEQQVVDLMGPKYKYLTVYVIYILLYTGIGNLLEVVGFDSIVTAYTIPLSMGLVTFFGIYYFGIKYQRLAFFKKYLFNPMELIQQFVPLISISFRLFGNILGGSIIIVLLTTLLNFIWRHVPYIGPVDLLAGVILPFLNMYFDIFDGLIQAYIFAILTIAYWSMEMNHGGGHKKKQVDEERIIKVENTAATRGELNHELAANI